MTDAFDVALDQLVAAYGEIQSGLPSAKLRRVAELLSALAGTVGNDSDKQALTSLHDKLVQEVQALEHRRVEVKAFKAMAAPPGREPGGLPGLSPDQAIAVGDHPAPAQPGTALPPGKVEEFKSLYELFAKAGDATARNSAVKQIRDFLAGLAFWSNKKESAEWLDDKIRSGTPAVIQIAVQELFKAITGHDAPDPSVDIITPEAPGEHLFHTPKLGLPGDKPPPAFERSVFLISGVQASYAPGAALTFTLSPPKHFYELHGAKRVAVVRDEQRREAAADRLAQKDVESDQPQTITLSAPARPGRYVVRVELGMSFEEESMADFQVTGAP